MENKFIGAIFNNIRILETDGKCYSKCKAECLLCGKIWNPRLDSIIYKKIKSCGCFKFYVDNHVGKVFNGIEILYQYGGAADKCRCKCFCGRIWEPTLSTITSSDTKSCGCKKYKSGDEHYKWKGGKHLVKKSGYVVLRINRKKIFEHRFVMEQHLGRKLLDTEYVHHKNGNKSDNNLKNLELWVTSQPKGQRPIDLVIWAKEILNLYDTDIFKPTI